jgi:hypothetical protein
MTSNSNPETEPLELIDLFYAEDCRLIRLRLPPATPYTPTIKQHVAVIPTTNFHGNPDPDTALAVALFELQELQRYNHTVTRIEFSFGLLALFSQSKNWKLQHQPLDHPPLNTTFYGVPCKFTEALPASKAVYYITPSQYEPRH